MNDMECERWREAISAVLDGEDPAVDERLLRAHLEHCDSCRNFHSVAERTRAGFRIDAAPAIPDLSARVVKANAVADRHSRWGLVRIGLALTAIEIVLGVMPDLLDSDPNFTAHAAHHLAAFSVAYAVGLFVVVVRPARARTMLPVAAVLAGALVLAAIVDAASGRVPFAGEASHLPEIVSVPLVWALTVPGPRRPHWPALRRTRGIDRTAERRWRASA